MTTFLNALKNSFSYKRTMNLAMTHDSSSDACLDLFALAGGMRYRSPKEQVQLMDRAYIENPELAMKLLFYIRDIRGGMGERKTFRTLLRSIAWKWPQSAEKNVQYISEYGRFDDLFCLLATPAENEVIRVIRDQLDKDLQALKNRESGQEKDTHVSLLAKWMPSINTSSRRTRELAKRLIELLDVDEKTYRKTLSRLRAASSVTERKLSAGKVSRIEYSAVSAGAMLKYRSAFLKQDGQRFGEYLKKVGSGDMSIHAETLFPYEIVRPIFGPCVFAGCRMRLDDPTLNVLEELWQALPKAGDMTNSVSVIDTSGSMYCRTGKTAVLPAIISQSLGLYHAERCSGTFHNHFITFESNPHLIEIRGKNLAEKLRYIQTAPWGGSTNLEKVFDLILQTAVREKTPQEEMPSVLYIISDMEFNCAVRNPGMTIYENAKASFSMYGYELPATVFINVNSWQKQVPVRAHEKGCALASGAGVSTFQHKFDGNVTPMSHMLRALEGERYARIHA